MLPDNYNFIVSDITATTMSFYCNCFFYGFEKIEYYLENDEEHKTIAEINKGFVTLKNLETGKYVINGISENGTKTVKKVIFFERHKDALSFLDIISKKYNRDKYIEYELKEKNYLSQLFDRYLQADNNTEKEELENELEIFSAGYDQILQKYSVNVAEDTFLIQDNCINMYFKEKTDFTWFYETYSNGEWIENGKRYSQDNPLKKLMENKLYRITLCDKDYFIKYFYIFVKSKKKSDEIFRNIIDKRKDIENNTYNDIPEFRYKQDNETLLEMFNIEPDLKTLLPSPLIDYDTAYDKIIIDNSNIKEFLDIEPNIRLSIVEDKKDFDGYYFENILVSKFKINSANREMPISEINISEDGNYYMYYEDENNNILSKPQFFNSENYLSVNKEYNSFIAERFERALYKTFNTSYRNIEDWNRCKNILDKYRMSDEQKNTSIVRYMIMNILDTREEFSSALKSIYAILKCDYDFFSNQNIRLGENQIFKMRYGVHMIPKNERYVKMIKIRNNDYYEKYFDISKSPFEQKIDSDGDIFIFQNVDKKTKKVSEPIVYSSSKNKVRYYFGRTQVIIDGEL